MCKGFACNLVFGIHSGKEMFEVNSVQILQLKQLVNWVFICLKRTSQSSHMWWTNAKKKQPWNYSHICPFYQIQVTKASIDELRRWQSSGNRRLAMFTFDKSQPAVWASVLAFVPCADVNKTQTNKTRERWFRKSVGILWQDGSDRRVPTFCTSSLVKAPVSSLSQIRCLGFIGSWNSY